MRQARASSERGGWSVAVAFGSPVGRARANRSDRRLRRPLAASASWSCTDRPPACPGRRSRSRSAGRRVRATARWWCPVTPERTLVIGGEWAAPAGAADLTCAYAALELIGPARRRAASRASARSTCGRASCRSARSVPARWPGRPATCCEPGTNALLVLVGWALGEYLWEVVADAAGNLGGGPVGEDAQRCVSCFGRRGCGAAAASCAAATTS